MDRLELVEVSLSLSLKELNLVLRALGRARHGPEGFLPLSEAEKKDFAKLEVKLEQILFEEG